MANLQRIIRSLHRDIGFLTIGLTIVMSMSGIVLIYRDTDIFKYRKSYEVQVEPFLTPRELADQLDFRRLDVLENNESSIVFEDGVYDKKTGLAQYHLVEYPVLLEKLNFVHRAISREKMHWVLTIYGVMLLFLALSAPFMYKPKSKYFKRGIYLTTVGIVLTVVLVITWH